MRQLYFDKKNRETNDSTKKNALKNWQSRMAP